MSSASAFAERVDSIEDADEKAAALKEVLDEILPGSVCGNPRRQLARAEDAAL